MIGTLFTAFAAYGAASQFFGDVRDCGAGTSLFTVNSVALDPMNPVPGQNVTLSLDYTVPAGITVKGGQTEYDITWNYIPFDPSYEPLCQDIPCPLGPGQYRNKSTSLWPDSVSGYITSQMKWIDDANQLLLCVEISGQAGDLRRVALIPSPPETKSLVLVVDMEDDAVSYRKYLRGGMNVE
jgi:hypothetical protein